MASQLADYEITGTIVEDATVTCLRGRRPARLSEPGTPVTIWVLGPLARSPWAAARARIEPAAAVRGDGLPDWLEAGVAEWASRSVIWVSTATQVTSTLGAPPPGLDVPTRLRALAIAARGAHALHEQGVLHGAICPQAVALHVESQAPGVGAVLAPPALADGHRLAVQIGYPPLAYVDPRAGGVLPGDLPGGSSFDRRRSGPAPRRSGGQLAIVSAERVVRAEGLPAQALLQEVHASA